MARRTIPLWMAGGVVFCVLLAGVWLGLSDREARTAPQKAPDERIERSVPPATAIDKSVIEEGGGFQTNPLASEEYWSEEDADASQKAEAQAQQIFEILSNDTMENAVAADRLLQLLPTLEGAAREEAAQHVINLGDEAVTRRWVGLLVADQVRGEATEVFYNALLNLPPEQTLPALARMAESMQHPMGESSRQVLETIFGELPSNQTWSSWVQLQSQTQP